MISSGALPKVALRKPPIPGPGVLGRVLGRLADQPRERDQRRRGKDELHRLVEIERVVHEHDERREADRDEEGAADHEPAILLAGGQSLDGSRAARRA